MAVNPPDSPSLVLEDVTRTITSITLRFVPGSYNGGNLITGYILYRDQGVGGSPYSMIYNGTSFPEIIFYNVTNLMTGHIYNF